MHCAAPHSSIFCVCGRNSNYEILHRRLELVRSTFLWHSSFFILCQRLNFQKFLDKKYSAKSSEERRNEEEKRMNGKRRLCKLDELKSRKTDMRKKGNVYGLKREEQTSELRHGQETSPHYLPSTSARNFA